MKKTVYLLFGGILLAMQLTTGCSAKLKDAYSFDTYQTRSLSTTAITSIPLFAQQLCVVTEAENKKADGLSCEAAALFDITDHKTLYGKNVFKELSPASITKVMTALVAIKYGDLEDLVTITPEALVTESGSSLANLKVGEVYTLEQLLYGLMLPSGNDAGNAIALHISGNIAAFSELMNQEAERLGAVQTQFKNPHGLTQEGHYTTAYDLYLIFQEALTYSEFRKVINTATYTVEYQDEKGAPAQRQWKVSNRYLSGDIETPEGLTVFGGKTGTTNAAGYCLMILTKDQQGKEYVSVILKAQSRAGLYENMTSVIKKILE